MTAAVQIFIRRHQFNVNCPAKDEDAMREAARLVEEKIKRLRDKTGVADDERMALMTALQIAFEAQHAPAKSAKSAAAPAKSKSAAAAAPDISGILRRIDDALARTESSLQGRAR